VVVSSYAVEEDQIGVEYPEEEEDHQALEDSKYAEAREEFHQEVSFFSQLVLEVVRVARTSIWLPPFESLSV
jgi:hypothetical protein